jgi:hypothetical protein
MEVAGGARRRLSAREEELLGLLAGFPDGSDRELSFSDLIVEAGVVASRPAADADAAPAPREDGGRGGALTSSPGRPAAASKQQRQQAARQRARRGSRGSCGGGGDGVLLNFYVPGLLTRSMTAPRPCRGPVPSPGAGQCAPPKAAAAAAAAGKASRSVTVKVQPKITHAYC